MKQFCGFASVADMTITCTLLNGPERDTYRISFYDAFTGKSAQMDVLGEGPAAQLFGAWFIADLTEWEQFEALIAKLYEERTVGEEFMP